MDCGSVAACLFARILQFFIVAFSRGGSRWSSYDLIITTRLWFIFDYSSQCVMQGFVGQSKAILLPYSAVTPAYVPLLKLSMVYLSLADDGVLRRVRVS